MTCQSKISQVSLGRHIWRHRSRSRRHHALSCTPDRRTAHRTEENGALPRRRRGPCVLTPLPTRIYPHLIHVRTCIYAHVHQLRTCMPHTPPLHISTQSTNVGTPCDAR
ncbi:hypothetical protein SCLCIDRAFT_374032 [Scleroderma citrinum Foug A]|uniref:Uncharacterized protein n=1 Tax=Scleroderma citrinum Foug A TaxID=1036808 RepID=A0A0C3DDP9_9AGAM|nr:hypothetical protein SCLCIDRAFT_374032 [Scleroderma citrinum Foug A]